MPVAVTITVSTAGAVFLLVLFLVLGFALGRTSKEEKDPLPTKAQLDAMAETLKAWMELGDTIAGWKAAVYGAAGVVLGALSGLAAEFITKGDMSAAQLGRAVGVLGVVVLFTVIMIIVIEHLRLVERFFKKDKAPDKVTESSSVTAAGGAMEEP